MEQQEITMEGLVIDDLAGQIATVSVDKAAWRARALSAEAQLEELKNDDSAPEDDTDEASDIEDDEGQ